MDQPSTSKRARWERYQPLSQNELEKYVADFMVEEDDISDHSDESEIDELFISDHDTQSEVSANEQETADSDEDIPLAQLAYFLGKDNTKWRKTAPPSTRTRHYNIFTGKPGPKGAAKNAVSVVDTWSLMISEEILQLIVQHTNIYIHTQMDRFSRERDARETNISEIKALIGLLYHAGTLKSAKLNTQGEIKALIGLLYHAGTLKSAKLNTQDLWAKDGSGIDIFIATMSRKRFLFLLKCLRFDSVLTRSQRKEIDKLAPIRELAEIFRKNIMNSFTIGEFATIDEKQISSNPRACRNIQEKYYEFFYYWGICYY
ncbi:Transposase IS4 [Popillia japonica]|uniref:Transposase IS4 n=1 Tax=Popillia japonica TaxID=7064 RepID=A0AAW1KK98_POPJA